MPLRKAAKKLALKKKGLKKKPRKKIWVVGLGASAGGLEALSCFFRALTPPKNAAFVVAQHLAPHAKSMMVELLQKQTAMPVHVVEDRRTIRAGEVAVVPPNFDVRLEGSRLVLEKAGEELRPKPSVNVFFESLARAAGPRAVGVILSGTGSDGSDGVRAIRQSGGLVFAQETRNAKYDGMPRAAIETGAVEEPLTAEAIATRLEEVFSEVTRKPAKKILANEHREILTILKRETGTDFNQYKPGTIGRRIEKRMARLGLTEVAKYLELLRKDAQELASLGHEMLVSVTSFLRDPDAFAIARKSLAQIIAEKRNGEEVRIWVAACATGEEAYSLCFFLDELIEESGKHLVVKVFATDLDRPALDFAREGIYSERQLTSLPAEFRSRYFDAISDGYRIHKRIRDQIVFARQDLVQNPPFVRIDFISCRNVLIYFEAELQNRVFQIFHYALRPGGTLFLGKSENAPAKFFDVEDRKAKVYRRSGIAASPVPAPRKYSSGELTGSNARQASVIDLKTVVPNELVTALGLAGFVIDSETTIMHIVGDTSAYVGVPQGHADFRLMNLLPKAAGVELSILVKKCARERGVYTSRPHRTSTTRGKDRPFIFSIRPLEASRGSSRGLFLVALQPEPQKTPSRVAKKTGVPESALPKRMMELEQELLATREHLQTLIEELEISNEELQSLNEEMSSTNEELQASNEELETTNEEMQASNEELTTLNEEVTTKSAELRAANMQLENVQDSIGAPMVVVDEAGRVLRFNRSSHLIFNLSDSDLGVPITEVSCRCEIPDFDRSLRSATETGQPSESLCEVEGRIYQMRMHPATDPDGRSAGAVIVFFDNTKLIRAEERVRTSELRMRSIIDGSPTMVTLKDSAGRYLLLNQAFLRRFGLRESEVIGKTDRELFPQEIATQFRDNDLEVLLRRAPTEREEEVAIGEETYVYFTSRFPLFEEDGRTPYAVGTVALDVTARLEAQVKLRQSESRYRAIVEDQAVFVCRHRPDGAITFSNAAYDAYFGAVRKTSGDFFQNLPKGELARVRSELEKLSYLNPIIQYEHLVPADGESRSRWVRWIHRALYDLDERLVEYQAVGFDVTEIHNRTEELLQQENFFTHVLEYTSDYLTVYRFDGSGFVLDSFNQSAAKGRAITRTGFIGMKLEELTDPAQIHEILPKYRQAAVSGHVSTFEEEVAGARGVKHLLTTLVPVRNSEGKIDRVAAISRDISRLKKIEEDLRVEKMNADSANQAKSDFLAAMSHELRTPLNVITGMSQLLARNELRPDQQRFVSSIQRSSKVLLGLIEDVLDLSKIEAGKISFESQEISLEALSRDVVQTFEALATQKGIRLESRTQGASKRPVLGDAVRIKQVLINLLGNAFKFTEKGSVALEVESNGDATPGIQTVLFRVRDTGIGIPKSSFSRIFQRFSQADSGSSRKFGGTGLGLSICKRLIELMGGEIGFESAEGMGSVFWFTLQLPESVAVGTGADAAGANVSENPVAKVAGITVLATDDNPESLDVVREMLTPHGARVIAVQSGREAIRAIENEEVDVVLMDVQMPELDGLETTRLIRKLPNGKARVPVIALTANAMVDDAAICKAAGMDDYVTKPVDFPALYRKIEKWAKRKNAEK